jgi:hypothetical protein
MKLFTKLATWFVICQSAMTAELPKYLFFNIAPGRNHFYTDKSVRNAFVEVPKALHVTDNPRLRIGVSFIFSTMETPTAYIVERVQTALRESEKTGVPVLIGLDGQNWWENRPDLWNWWDPKKPGYNPSNIFNVEWTGWNPTNAIKVSWRNWGAVRRVAPAQNIASPNVLEAQLLALRQIVPVIAEWYRKLPENRKWLLGGVKLGWEASIGYNAYYYPDGNHYIEQWPDNPARDPNYALNHDLGLSSGAAQIGYSAVKTAGIKNFGEITRAELGQVTASYLRSLCRTASESGLPKELIFTHEGGTYDPWSKHMPFSAAINDWSAPGWSLYNIDPNTVLPLADQMAMAQRRSWAACEWWWGAGNAREWEEHFARTLHFRDCRFIDVYNWTSMFSKEAAGQDAVRNLVGKW